MIKLFLERVVGCDTVSVRSFNITQAFIILCACVAVSLGVGVSLPPTVINFLPLLAVCGSLSFGFGIASFMASHIMRARICGAVSLLFGVISNTIITAGSVPHFPPFDTLIISSPLLAIWYFIAFLFIFEVEGYDVSADRAFRAV